MSAALRLPCSCQQAYDSNSIIQYSLCPTFMIIFMDLVLHTPPSWLSMPSMVPLDVATAEERERRAGLEWAVTVSICYKKMCWGNCVIYALSLSLKNSQFPKTTKALQGFCWGRIWLIPTLIKSQFTRSSPQPLRVEYFTSPKSISLSNCDCDIANRADGPCEGGS